MKHRKLFSFLAAFFCLSLAALAWPVVSNAQGRYVNTYSKRDVSNIIARLERSSDTFRRDFDRYLDRRSSDNPERDDRFNRIVDDYENSLDRLRREYDRHDSWWQSRNNVQNVMRDAREVNAMMNSLPFARRLERQWNQMRRDINKLADTYDLPDLAGGGGGNWGGGNAGNVPNWARGTFYARNPQTGGTITLRIENNGTVVADLQGAVTYGTYLNNNRINIDGVLARVTRLDNGIRTTRIDNGERIDYSRDNVGGGNWGDGGGNVPDWAIGTFYARNPQTGGDITLTIQSNGNVVVNSDGGVIYGSMNGTTLNVNGATSRVQRDGNGIRTTRSDNGERINYRRQ